MPDPQSFPSDFLKRGLEELSIPYVQEQIDLCSLFFREYKEFSKKINISNIQEPREFVVKHLLDSLSALPFLGKSTKSIADLGSGGGFPGIVLGIFTPKVQFALIDVVEKKVNYLRHVLRVLELPNIQAFNASKEKVPGNFDLIVSRALGSISKILLYSKPYLGQQTKILAYKARLSSVQEELSLLKTPLKSTVIPVKIPFLKAERNLVLLNRERKN